MCKTELLWADRDKAYHTLTFARHFLQVVLDKDGQVIL